MDRQSKLYILVITVISTVVIAFNLNNFVVIIFAGCVHFLDILGRITGLGYVGINVLLFCLFLPIYIVYSIVELNRRKQTINTLKERIKSLENN